ncbi:MAG: hypothetical protein DHS20C13_01510 [Thermodesulfobacteriota bacterium]|nr:MAG: hypothetical protein DHS20C13_01510 [Thermodesulfobacteriota bacterium]
MSKNIWGDLLNEKQGFAVPRVLRLKRKELGLNNQEYILLLDYLDCYKHGETEDLHVFLAELNGVSQKTIQRRLSALEKKGLLRQEINVNAKGRIKGVIFNPEPLVEKLKSITTSLSLNKEDEKVKSLCESQTEYTSQTVVKEKKWKDEFCSTRWYNDVFSEMYEEASGQPVLTGGREFKSAETYFSRLRQLNPELTVEALFVRATEGARYILDSQIRGGVFGWLHKPPDICMLANQTQAVDYQLRCIEKIYGKEEKFTDMDSEESNVKVLFSTKDKEKENGSEQIERVFEELREIEQKDVRRDFPQGLRKGLSGDKS